jgi:hypothetical protein
MQDAIQHVPQATERPGRCRTAPRALSIFCFSIVTMSAISPAACSMGATSTSGCRGQCRCNRHVDRSRRWFGRIRMMPAAAAGTCRQMSSNVVGTRPTAPPSSSKRRQARRRMSSKCRQTPRRNSISRGSYVAATQSSNPPIPAKRRSGTERSIIADALSLASASAMGSTAALCLSIGSLNRAQLQAP